MSSESTELGDLDAVLDALEAPGAPGAIGAPLPPTTPAGSGGAPIGAGDVGLPTPPPPPIPAKARRPVTGSGPYTGRTAFPDLFAPIPGGTAVPIGSPEDKVIYFREKLKQAEAQLARFRFAWDTREQELTKVEGELAAERELATQNQARLEKLQRFVDAKRQEIDEYSQQVAAAFAEKEQDAEKLREDVDRVRSAQARTHDILEKELAARDEAINRLRKMAADQRERLAERDEKIDTLAYQAEEEVTKAEGIRTMISELEERDELVDRLHLALKFEGGKVNKLEAEVEELRERLLELTAQESNYDLAKIYKALGVASKVARELDVVRGLDVPILNAVQLGENLDRLERALGIARRLVESIA